MRTQAIKCDVCGKLKGEKNNWFLLQTMIRIKSLGVFVFNDINIALRNITNDEGASSIEDICSDACLKERLRRVYEQMHNPEHISLPDIKGSDPYKSTHFNTLGEDS